MIAGQWISTVKNTPIPKVLTMVGLKPGMRNSFGPCPACNEESRGKEDKRGACGMTKDRRGWGCHQCKVKGDALDLLAWVQVNSSSSELSKAQWGELREWCVRTGLTNQTESSPAPRVQSMSSTIDELMGKKEKRERSPASIEEASTSVGSGPFRWSDNLAKGSEELLWNSDTGAKVLGYLRKDRAFTDEAIKEWGLGCKVIKGEPWLTIPLRDDSERVVNVRFRSVPPAKKTYRVCPGRPLPLFGSHNLSHDTSGNVIVCEGELDVIAMWQYGLTAGVVSGTAGAGAWKDEWLDQLEPYNGYTLCYDNDEAGEDGAKGFANKMGVDRCSRAILPRKDAGECLVDGVSSDSVMRVLGRAQPMFGVEFKRVGDFEGDLERLLLNPDELKGRSTGSSKLDRCLGGLRPGLMVVSGDTGHGKAGEVSEPILTPSGWTTYGEVKVGDKVISVDGTPTAVVGVFPQGVRRIAEVEMSCGTVCRVDWDHLWEVQTDVQASRGKPGKVLTTSEISESVKDGSRYRYRVPLVAPVQHQKADLPVEPYTLGVLLGDGGLTSGTVLFYNPEQDIIERVRSRLPLGHTMSERQAQGCIRCIVSGIGFVGGSNVGSNHVLNGLRDLGVMGLRSYEKHVPRQYLFASVEQRLELLRGLMDTDGGVEQGYPVFCSSSPELAQGLRDLVHSLGGSTRGSSKIPSYTHNGERRKGRRSYTVRINLPASINPFHLPRKREAVNVKWAPRRKIVAVRDAGEAECVCIAVDHPRHLYVTKGYIVTHNTTWATWMLWQQALAGVPALVTSFEQRPIGTVQKLLRMQLGGDFTTCSQEQRAESMKQLTDLPIHILDHYGNMPAKDMMQAMRYAVRRMGVKVVLIDHLGFLLDEGLQDRVGHIEAVIRALALTGVSLGCTILLVCHPKGLQHGALRVTINDIKGASAIKQDAHSVVIVERDVPKKRSKGKTRGWPASWIHFDKVRSEFGVPGSKSLLAFGPKSCRYADSWEETPEGMSGALIVGPSE